MTSVTGLPAQSDPNRPFVAEVAALCRGSEFSIPDSRIAGSRKEDIHQENDRRESVLTMHRKPTWLVEVSTGS
ncbi:MAG TPA: hypothetical protein VGY52_04515, partial [Roseiarcus sp.]|nr:hypothetical protein [Roseiarcus sp.]